MAEIGRGVVTAWEPELFAEARHFAAAHERRFVAWASGVTPDTFAEGIDRVASLTVFISSRQMTYDLLRSLILISVRSELPVGLIPCAPHSQVPLTPQLTSVANALRDRTLLYSYFFLGHSVPGVSDTYGRPDSEAFLEEADRGAKVIVLHTHGNGADAPIGDAILCARVDGRPATSRLARCLPCQVGGPCIREHRDVRLYFSPSHLRCHALVFLSCTGFPPADSLLQYRGLTRSCRPSRRNGPEHRDVDTSRRIIDVFARGLHEALRRRRAHDGRAGARDQPCRYRGISALHLHRRSGVSRDSGSARAGADPRHARSTCDRSGPSAEGHRGARRGRAARPSRRGVLVHDRRAPASDKHDDPDGRTHACTSSPRRSSGPAISDSNSWRSGSTDRVGVRLVSDRRSVIDRIP